MIEIGCSLQRVSLTTSSFAMELTLQHRIFAKPKLFDSPIIEDALVLGHGSSQKTGFLIIDTIHNLLERKDEE